MEGATKSTPRRMPSFRHHASGQSPLVGAEGSSCAGAFYNMIDWNRSKRFSSITRRISAERPNQDALNASRDGNFTERTSRSTASKLPREEVPLSTAKNVPAFHSTPSPASEKSDATSKRSPGVVARLMGLESLPASTTQNSFTKSGTPQELHSNQPPPVLLQELLRLELQHSKKSFKDKLPGFTKKSVDPKPGRGDRGISQKKSPSAYFLPHGHSRSFRPSLPVQEDIGASLKQPFLARLHAGAPMPQSSNSPVLSPSTLGGKNTVRLLEAAVKSLEPVPRKKYSLTIGDSSRVGTPSESGGSFRSEKPKALGGYGRVGSPANSSSKPVRSQLGSRTRSGKDDRAVQSGHESSSPGSRSTSRARYKANRQARSVSPLQSHRSRTSNARKTDDSPRPLLRTHEASIRGFKIDLSNQGDSPLGKKLKRNDSLPQAVELDALPENLPRTPSPNIDRTLAKRDYPEPCTPDQNVDVNGDVNENSPSTPIAVPEKSSSSAGFRSVRFRSRSSKQEKDVEVQGNLTSPSHKASMEKSVGPSPPKETKVAGAGFTLFSSRKQGNKKKGNEKGEALVMKRTDSTWMRNLFGRPLGSTRWTSKSSKKVNVEVEAERMEPAEDDVALQAEPASSPGPKQLEKTKEGSNDIVQTRYRSIDDVFPELPIEEDDESRPSPDLEKTIRAVEKRFLGFGSQGDADYRSIERMFGKAFSRTYLASSLASPESSSLQKSPVSETIPSSPEACGVPGTFPNSPLAKLETSLFSSRNQLNLHDMFEVVSGSLSYDSPGRRRSFCLSEPRERVLDEDEEAGAVSETYSNSVSGGTPEHVEIIESDANNESSDRAATDLCFFVFKDSTEDVTMSSAQNPKLSGASEWSEGVMTPPALKMFEEKLANVCVTTPPALKMFEENFAQEDATTPPALKRLEEKFEHEDMKTPPVLKKFEEELALEDVTTPKFEEKLALEGVMTPPALKKFEEKLAQGFSDFGVGNVVCPDEFGQPSPVSVLQSPFLDEVSTTPDASLAELQLTDEHLNDTGETEPSAAECVEDETEETSENTATSKVSKAAMPEVIQTEMIEQAILDISRIRNIDVKSIGLEPATIIAPVEPQQEENYIREVLNAANLLLRKGESASWHPALNQSLFNKLESGRLEKGPSVRSERKLLFDSVHEVMVLEPWLKTSSFYVDLPMFPELQSNSKFRSPIFGEALVHDVHRMICHWRDIAGNCLDDLIDYDMNVPEGRWVEFGYEVADVGRDIERTLLRTMILDVVDDLTSISAIRALTKS